MPVLIGSRKWPPNRYRRRSPWRWKPESRGSTVVTHVRTDIADIKADLQTRLDRLESNLDRLNDGLYTAKISALLLYIALAGTLLGAMAGGFGWI